MKMFAWVISFSILGMLAGCSDQTDQSSMRPAELAVSKLAAVQAALDQVIDARNAIKKADDDKALALKNVQNKHEAVQAAIALATKESEMLKKKAATQASWALETHERAMASRKTLLLAALAQSKAKQILIEKQKAVEDARVQNLIHQHDAQIAMIDQLKAAKLLRIVVEAERLATLSINLVASDSDLASFTPPKPQQVASQKQTLSPPIASKARPVTKKQATRPTTKKVAQKQLNKRPAKQPMKLVSSSTNKADAERGHGLAQKCQRCHTFEPNQRSKFGPNLFGVVGQQAGKSQHYKYGSALSKADFSWNEKNLSQWICNSDKTIKKLTGNKYAITKMSAQKVCGQDAKDVVAFLRTLKSQASIKGTTGS